MVHIKDHCGTLDTEEMPMEYNQEQFQKTMRRLIGSRTMADFAALCEISRTNLSRLMSDRSYQPSKNTLRKIADHTDADYEELLAICGYAESPAGARRQRPFTERIRLNAMDMESGFAGITGSVHLHESVQDFLEEYLLLYSHESCKYAVGKQGEYEGEKPGIENYACVAMTFREQQRICCTYAVIYYAETRGGKIIVVDTAMDGKSLMEVGFMNEKGIKEMGLDQKKVADMEYVYYVRESFESRLYRKIFEETTWYPTTYKGFGFYVEGTPSGFNDFLRNHIHTLPKCTAIFDEYLSLGDREPEMYFKHYRYGTSVAGGITAVIASIMEEETGVPFEGFNKDEGEFPPCVMIPETEPEYESSDFNWLKDTVGRYAKELGLRKYGSCLASGVICEDDDMQFTTEEGE